MKLYRIMLSESILNDSMGIQEISLTIPQELLLTMIDVADKNKLDFAILSRDDEE